MVKKFEKIILDESKASDFYSSQCVFITYGQRPLYRLFLE